MHPTRLFIGPRPTAMSSVWLQVQVQVEKKPWRKDFPGVKLRPQGRLAKSLWL